MRIVYLSSSIIPSQKANSVQVVKMCNAFSELGHEVTLFARLSDPNNDFTTNDLKKYYGIKNNIELYRLSASNCRLFGGLEYAFKVCRAIKKLNINPDILYGRNLYALTLCQFFNKPIIYESHAIPVFGRKALENYLLSRPQFKLLVVVNKHLYDYYFNNFSIFKNNPHKILLASDGSDLSETIKITTNIENKVPLIGYAGSLYPGKGVETIIKIAEEMPEYNFAIAGGTDQQIKSFKQNCKLKNINFIGFLPPSTIPDFLSKCDILLAPYSREVYSENHKKINISDWMSPLKIFDYMASKKPIIASNLPAIKEILENEKTSLLVDPEDISEWKNSIVKILCKPNFAKDLSENAYKLLKDKYTWKLRAERVLKINSNKTCIKANKEELLFNTKRNLSNINDSTQSPIFYNPNKPIILHIIGDLNVGGTERNLLKILSRLNNLHFEHRVITLFEPGKLADNFRSAGIKVDCVNISKNIAGLLCSKAVFKLVKQIKTINPVIIQTWLYHSNNLINLLSPLLNIPIINSIRHDNPKAGSLKTVFSAKIGAYISRITKIPIIYCSENSLKSHTDIGYSKKESSIIPNGFIISEIDKNQSKIQLKEKFNIQDNYRIAINVGRYCSEKDYPTLFHSIKLVIDKYPQIVFILCGKGLDNNNTALSKINFFSEIKNNLVLLGNQTNIEKIMAGADFLVSSSSSEAFPNVIAEAMSVQTPCIATDTGETSKIIGNTGIVVEPKNPTALANAILKLANYNENKLSLIGINAQNRIRNNYSLEKTITQFENLYLSKIYVLTDKNPNDKLKQ